MEIPNAKPMAAPKKITIEDLAIMVQNGFNDVEERLGGKIDGLKQEFEGLKQDVNSLKQDVGGLKKDVNGLKQDVLVLKEDVDVIKEDVKLLKQGQERIESNMVYRLEFEKLEDQVVVLENKGKGKVKK